MDSKERQKIILLFTIMGAAILVSYFNLLLRPRIVDFGIKNSEYRKVRARVKAAEALIRNEEKIKTQYERLRQQSLKLEKKLAGQNEISSLLEEFSRIAEESGIKILRLKPIEPIERVSVEAGNRTNFYVEFPILIEASGGYHQLGVFIDKLEGMDKFIEIDALDIKGNPRDVFHHDARLRLRTYIVKK